jgi:hypothetical protein
MTSAKLTAYTQKEFGTVPNSFFISRTFPAACNLPRIIKRYYNKCVHYFKEALLYITFWVQQPVLDVITTFFDKYLKN